MYCGLNVVSIYNDIQNKKKNLCVSSWLWRPELIVCARLACLSCRFFNAGYTRHQNGNRAYGFFERVKDEYDFFNIHNIYNIRTYIHGQV